MQCDIRTYRFVKFLMTWPRLLDAIQVQKIDVNYDKESKQVDVRMLKESLWGGLQHIQIAADTVRVFLLHSSQN